MIIISSLFLRYCVALYEALVMLVEPVGHNNRLGKLSFTAQYSWMRKYDANIARQFYKCCKRQRNSFILEVL